MVNFLEEMWTDPNVKPISVTVEDLSTKERKYELVYMGCCIATPVDDKVIEMYPPWMKDSLK